MKNPIAILKLLALISTVLILCCSSPTNSEEKTDHSNQTIYFNRLTESGAEIVIQNVNHEQISFSGYSMESPLKQVEVFRNGKWELLYWDWCGTGAENQILRKEESTRFLVGLPSENTKLRVGVSVRFDGSEEYEQIWSDEFSVN